MDDGRNFCNAGMEKFSASPEPENTHDTRRNTAAR